MSDPTQNLPAGTTGLQAMQGGMSRGFPVTLWPGVILDEPLVERWGVELDEGDEGWLVLTGPREPEKLPIELVIRELLDLRIEVDDDVLDFVRTYGLISRPHDAVKIGTIRHAVSLGPAGSGFARALDSFEHASEINALDYRLRAEAHANNPRVRNCLRDVRAYLHDARRLARTWIAWMDDGYVAPVWFHLGRESQRSPRNQRAWEATLERDGWSDFAHTLNDGLRSFPPRAEHRVSYSGVGEVVHGEPMVGLFSALCLQLMNLILEDHETLNTCGNEVCGHRFIRQRGTAEQGQYRLTGVNFCTKKCADAQRQRENRRRKKEQSQ